MINFGFEGLVLLGRGCGPCFSFCRLLSELRGGDEMVGELFFGDFFFFFVFALFWLGSCPVWLSSLVPFGSCSFWLWAPVSFGSCSSWFCSCWLLVFLWLPSLVAFLFVFLWLLSGGTTKGLGSSRARVSFALIYPLAPGPVHSCLLIPLTPYPVVSHVLQLRRGM